jgi:hypothetical protein
MYKPSYDPAFFSNVSESNDEQFVDQEVKLLLIGLREFATTLTAHRIKVEELKTMSKILTAYIDGEMYKKDNKNTAKKYLSQMQYTFKGLTSLFQLLETFGENEKDVKDLHEFLKIGLDVQEESYKKLIKPHKEFYNAVLEAYIFDPSLENFVNRMPGMLKKHNFSLEELAKNMQLAEEILKNGIEKFKTNGIYNLLYPINEPREFQFLGEVMKTIGDPNVLVKQFNELGDKLTQSSNNNNNVSELEGLPKLEEFEPESDEPTSTNSSSPEFG